MVFKKIIPILALTIFGGLSSVHAKLHFADIDTTHPNFLAIDHLADQSIVNGYTVDGKLFFRALQPVNRAEAVKIILLTAGIEPEIETASFNDVPKDAWFTPYVGTAEYFELVNGFNDGNFHSEAQVTRAEFLSILLKSFQVPVETEAGQEWFDPLIEFANSYNIIDSAEVSPHKALTRGDIVEIAYRMLKVSEKEFTNAYIYSGTGSASYYNEGFAGKQTANGEIYDPMAMTAAHRTLPFETRLKVWEINNPDKSVIVRITDRGPYHSSRIIDLSEKAFSGLAPISRGILEVGFEVFFDEEKAAAPLIVPSDIQEEFTKDALPPLIPDDIIPELSSATPAQKEQAGETITHTKTQPLFTGSTAFIPKNFYEGLTMRQSFPQKIQIGSIIALSGRADESVHKEVTVFLQPLSETKDAINQQLVFTSTVNFQNFVVPIRFLKAGKYQMGVVFDDNRRSKVVEIEILKSDVVRQFDTPEADFSTGFDLKVLPDEQMVRLSWDNDFGTKRINKVEIRPQNSSMVTKALYIESGLDESSLPYDFFTHAVGSAGGHDGIWSFDFFAATSVDQTLASQNSTWRKIGYKNFRLIPGFEDSESKDFSLEGFDRFTDKGYELFTGRILNPNKKVRDQVLLKKPNGTIEEVNIVKIAEDAFKFRVDFDDEGTYVIEVIADDGEILFNRAVYKYDEVILPVLSWFRQKANATNTMGVKNWINAFRRSRKVSDIYTKAELNELAQQYAEQMATENFIGHISPSGVTFNDRIRRSGLEGEYAENVAFGSDFQLALDGLQDSASHFRNVVSRKWSKVGIGIAKNSDGYFVVQIFGR